MSHDGTAGPKHVSDHDGRHLARESHLMRSIVRNMVANMEGVLSDLQGIMGDIQSLVVQIDNVTEKIDQQCGVERQEMSAHRVQKPRCLHTTVSASDQRCADAAACRLSDQPVQQQVGSLKDTSLNEPIIKGGNMARVRQQPPPCSRGKASCNPRPKSSDVHSSFEKSDLIEKLAFVGSRSFHNFSKDNGGPAPLPCGGIAVVHPTIYKNKESKCVLGEEKIMDKMKKAQHAGHLPRAMPSSTGPLPVVQCLPLFARNIPRLNLSSRLHHRCSEIRSGDEKKDDTGGGCGIVNTSRVKHAVTSVYNKSFQAVTPTEPLSPSIGSKNINSENKHNFVKCSSKEAHQSRANAVITQKIQERLGSSLPGSPRLSRSVSCLPHGSSPSSPQMQRSSTKVIYSKIDGSTPSTFGRSPGPTRIQQPSPHHYYHSIDSDLDSEAVNDCPGTRSMTPDIDWSYLNLVGNDKNSCLPPGKWRNSEINNDGYEVPMISKHHVGPRTFQMLQTSPDVVAQLPSFSFRDTKPDAKSRDGKLQEDHVNFELVLKSSLLQHIFCSELGEGEADFYCGCYEAIVDSVLENIAGYETFEEACEDFDNEGIAYESYVSFDDEFEEDDWDMGLRPEDHEYFDTNLPLFNAQNYEDFGLSIFGSLNDINKNTEHVGSNVQKVKSNNVQFYFCLEEGLDEKKTISPHNLKRSSVPEEDLYDDMEFPSTSGNSFTDDDCCAIKPQLPNSHTNFMLWPKPLAPAAGPVKERSHSSELTESQMSSSDDASCQAVGSGSPMSFSSPDAAFTSPDTDRFVTSSEGDDLLTSQEESYFRMSDHAVSPRSENIIPKCPTTSIRPREFLQSLYIFCQQRDEEMTRGKDASRSKESSSGLETAAPKMDNSRDNLSDTGSYTEDLGSYNRNVNTWTAYAMVHMQSDDVSDSTSDILNDNNVTSSMTASYIDADNIGTVGGNQTLSF